MIKEISSIIVFSCYLFIGIAWTNNLYNERQLLRNPLYKPFILLFWPITFIACIIYIVVIKPIISWVVDVYTYFIFRN